MKRMRIWAFLITFLMITSICSVAAANSFTNTSGYYLKNIPINTSSVNSKYQAMVVQGQNAWNNANIWGRQFNCTSISSMNNTMSTNSYSDSWLGLYSAFIPYEPTN